MNAQSVVNKCDNLEQILLSYDPHVMIITETWLSSAHPDDVIFPPSYKVYRRDRLGRGGGVAILAKHNVEVLALNQIEQHESVCCKINFRGNTVVVIGVYRAPSAVPDFMHQLHDYVDRYRNHKLIIAGDFNLGDIDWTTLRCGGSDAVSSEVLLDMMTAYDLIQIVHEPTRITNTSASLLDLVLVSSGIRRVTVSVDEGISDHSLVYFVVMLSEVRNNGPSKFITAMIM